MESKKSNNSKHVLVSTQYAISPWISCNGLLHGCTLYLQLGCFGLALFGSQEMAVTVG